MDKGLARAIESNKRVQKSQEIANLKESIRSRGIIPVLKDNILYVYRITGKKGISELSAYYRDNMYDLYDVVVFNDRKFQQDLCKASYLQSFRNMINYRQSTFEEIWNYFDLNDEEKRKKFVEENAREREIPLPINDRVYKKYYMKENARDIINRIAFNYVTCTYKRDSKIAAIIHLIGISNYFNLDYIASLVCNFLYSKKIDFFEGTNIINNEEWQVCGMRFTDKENLLSEDEKISLIKSIIENLNIECVYCEEIDKISDYQLESMFGPYSREDIIDFSKHNNSILENEVFSDLFNKVESMSLK